MAEVLGIYLPAPFDAVAIGLSLDGRLTPFAAGLVYLSDVGYFVSLSLFGLLIAIAALARR
jgi:ABC-2 type transport system permease protein